jgi:hypothetical protein
MESSGDHPGSPNPAKRWISPIFLGGGKRTLHFWLVKPALEKPFFPEQTAFLLTPIFKVLISVLNWAWFVQHPCLFSGWFSMVIP